MWRAEADRLLRGASYDRRLRTRTLEGITLEPIYGAAETGGLAQVGSFPGCPPYLRGARPLRKETTLDEETASFEKEKDCGELASHARLGEGGLARLAFGIAAADRSGVERDSLRGSVAFDPIGEVLAAGSIPMPLEGALDEMAAMTAWAAENAPGLGTVGVHGEVFHNGGAHTVQDLAFSLATAVFYLRALEDRGDRKSVV